MSSSLYSSHTKRMEEYIDFKLYRHEIENVLLGYKFCDEKWKLFKEDTEDTIIGDLWDAFNNYGEAQGYEDMTDYIKDNDGNTVEYLKDISDEEFWSNTDKELERQHKVKELKEITIPNIFATKIQQFYLKAKYNPRTKIGKAFIYKLYHENFSEEE